MPQNTGSQGLTYPLSGDAANGATQIQVLAEQVDAKLDAIDTSITDLDNTKSETTHSHSDRTKLASVAWGYVGSGGIPVASSSSSTWSAWSYANVAVVAGRNYLLTVMADVVNSSTVDGQGTGANIEVGIGQGSSTNNPTIEATARVWVTDNNESNAQHFAVTTVCGASTSGTRRVGFRVSRSSSAGIPALEGGYYVLTDIGPA